MKYRLSFFLRWSIVLILALSLLAACAMPSRPPLSGLVPGKEVETLQSPISVTVKSAGHSMGGRGFLVFKRPDRFHVAILSPFGTTLADIYSDGDRLACIVPGRQAFYTGLVSDLPEAGGLKAWAMMRWVVEKTPAAGPAVKREHVNSEGMREELFYDSQGLLERKENQEGDTVIYHAYRNIEGVAFPESIELTNVRGDRVRVSFDEPEINLPVDDTVLTPRPEGMTVLPLSEFRGF